MKTKILLSLVLGSCFFLSRFSFAWRRVIPSIFPFPWRGERSALHSLTAGPAPHVGILGYASYIKRSFIFAVYGIVTERIHGSLYESALR